VSVDQRDPWNQPTAAADHDVLVDRDLTEPADLGADEFCQRQASSRNQLLLPVATNGHIQPVPAYDRRPT